jgi:predicted NAD-dependent protein-ADP-ribosyltransferase YbiA (DUF1768 family)
MASAIRHERPRFAHKKVDSKFSLDPVPVHFNSRMNGVKQLSNFATCVLGGRRTTVEHEYQARKMEAMFGDVKYAEHIRLLSTPQQAKKAGSMGGWIDWMKKEMKSPQTKVALKKEFKSAMSAKWIPQSESQMRKLLMEKFNPVTNPDMWHFLDSTQDRPLHEVGRPNVWTKSGGDLLGRLLCKVRDHYRLV